MNDHQNKKVDKAAEKMSYLPLFIRHRPPLCRRQHTLRRRFLLLSKHFPHQRLVRPYMLQEHKVRA
jgi:hypothetical protein